MLFPKVGEELGKIFILELASVAENALGVFHYGYFSHPLQDPRGEFLIPYLENLVRFLKIKPMKAHPTPKSAHFRLFHSLSSHLAFRSSSKSLFKSPYQFMTPAASPLYKYILTVTSGFVCLVRF